MADPVASLSETSKVNAVTNTAKTDTAINKPSPTDANTSVDQVKLTERAKSIEALSAALAEGGFVDHEKVARIKKLIDSGEYKIDTESIAKKLLALEKDLSKV